MKRRSFIGNSIKGVLIGSTGYFPFDAFSNDPNLTQLTILHTNDLHSRIDPFPMDGSRNAGAGGAAKRAQLIKQIRSESENVILLDSGDIFQGTPYFNVFGGELEMKLMSEMGYDASTMGNHDFDLGIDGFEKHLKHTNFPFITSNYDFSNTLLKNKTKQRHIIEKDGIKVGLLGVGIKLKGLVPPSLTGDTVHLDPIKTADEEARILKQEFKCDYVICLSHLGYRYNSTDRASDVILAESTENIDLILGGHTHTFLRAPETKLNRAGKEVMINQVGFGGILLGKIDLVFEKNRKGRCVSCENRIVE